MEVSLASILAQFQAPSSVVAKFTNVPAPIISIFESSDAFIEYYEIVNDLLPPDQAWWINALSPEEWGWITSEASRVQSNLVKIESLWSIGISDAMVTISSSASASNQTVIATLEGFGTEFTTTAYPAPSDIPPPASTGMAMPELVGLSLGIPAGVWIVIVLLVLFSCGGFESLKREVERIRLEKAQRQAARLRNRLGMQAVDSRNPVLPFTDHNVRDFATETTCVHGDSNEVIELAEIKDENDISSAEESLKHFPVSSEAGEESDQPSTRNSVSGADAPQLIKRKPVGSISSRRVVSMEGVPIYEQVDATTSIGGDNNRKEDGGCVDAVEMSATPVLGHMRQESSEGREGAGNANVAEDRQKNKI